MTEPYRKTIPEQLMEAQQEIARLRAENQPTKPLLAELAEVRAQLETTKTANAALLTQIAALRAGQGVNPKAAAVTPPISAVLMGAPVTLQAEVARLEVVVATKKAELTAARSKYDCVAIARLEGELASARAAHVAARKSMDHARLDAEFAAKISTAARAGALRSGYRDDDDRAQQAAIIANTTAKLKADAAVQEQIAESYREKLGIT